MPTIIRYRMSLRSETAAATSNVSPSRRRVARTTSEETAAIVDTMRSFGEAMLLQEYIQNPGVDIRALVVGGRVMGSMKRMAQMHEWRSNIHLGAKGVPIELDDHSKDIAVRASKAVGLEISGVDMIFRGDEPVVLEVNASPGFRGLFQATNINAAEAMVEYAITKATG